MPSLQYSSFTLEGTCVHVYRDDLNHATISGNKLHKLSPNIAYAKTQKCSSIVSFGGPYSNHLHALAWACKQAGLKSIGVVRGELHAKLTPTLEDCQKWGMRLIASQRKDYRAYQEALADCNTPCLAQHLPYSLFSTFGKDTLVIPEGGSNTIAINCVAEAYSTLFESHVGKPFTHAICATGTGATLAGLYLAAPEPVNVIGIQAVAEGDATLSRVHNWISGTPSNLKIEEGHLGGFAKMPYELIEFIEQFERTHAIPLDPIYNGKAMFKVVDMIKAGNFKDNDQILFIHTGGLQGKRNKAD